MKTLVTGARGLLGPFLLDGLTRVGEVVGVTRAECDLGDRDAVAHMLDELRPDAVVHAAAFTDVDGCQRDPERARRDNVLASANLAATCAGSTQLVFLSTDQVYPDSPGLHQEPYTGPVNEYGRTKLAAEEAVRLHEKTLVLRVNFFGASRTPGRHSLSDVIVAALEERRVFPGFVDSFFSPLHASTLADQLAHCLDDSMRGVYNLGSVEGASKADFARMIARQLHLDDGLVDSTNSGRLSERAPRPHDLRMEVGAYTRETGRMLPTLWEEVRRL